MRPMAETFFLRRTPDGRPQKALRVPQQPSYFFCSVIAFVPHSLGEEEKKGQGGGIRWSRVNQQRATDLASGEGEKRVAMSDTLATDVSRRPREELRCLLLVELIVRDAAWSWFSLTTILLYPASRYVRACIYVIYLGNCKHTYMDSHMPT